MNKEVFRLKAKCPGNWNTLPFGDAIKDATGGKPKVKKGSYKQNGSLAVIDQGQELIGGYIDDERLACREKLPCILFGDHTKIFKFINQPFALGADGVKVLVPKGEFDKRFLYHYLNTLKLPNNAGYSRHFKFLKEKAVVKPPLAEQKRIAAILDKAAAIRSKRRQAIQLADEFLRSVFLDMFGDPVSNKKGWERCDLEEVLEKIDSGWSPKCYDRAANIDEWGVLKLGAVTSCRYLGQENKALPRDLEPREDIEVKKGDLLFTRKNTYELVAACSFVYETRPKLMLSDTIFRFNFKRNAAILPEYAWALLTHTGKRKDLQKLASGSAGSMPNISKSRLMKQLIELPPIELQKKFRNVFYRVRSCIESQSYAHNLATEFFNSLSQRAFRGEL